MPLVTSKASDFTAKAVVNAEITETSLAKIQDGKWLVLFFYPPDFTFVCPTEITAYSDNADKFKEAGANLAAVSVDSAFSHLAWVNTPRDQSGHGKINDPLVADLIRFASDLASFDAAPAITTQIARAQ